MLLPLISNTPDRVIFSAIGPGPMGSTAISVIASGNRAYFDIMEMPTFDPNGTMYQIPMASAPTEDMQIATKKYVDDHAIGGMDMGITGATVGQIAKITAVDASGVPTAWSPVDMPSGMPNVTGADNGKFLRVVGGAWAATEISSANGVSF